jgi:hypothetical protein
MRVRKYLPLVGGLALCLLAGLIELRRALDGHRLSWVYAVEWPFFAVVGTYIWWRTWHPPADDEDRVPDGRPRSIRDTPASRPDGARSQASADPELAAWESYLARLHAADPPGGPPDKR